jgi:structure-specific endonuclease subunit SLX1
VRTCPTKKGGEEPHREPIVDNIIVNKVADTNAHADTNTTKSSKKRYFCYFLGQQCDKDRGPTYNGYTVNLNRRLRQHNGEIKGGAFATSKMGKGPWQMIAVLTSESWTAVRAMQVEWLCRYPTRKKPRPQCFAGPRGRIQSLAEIARRLEPGENIRLFIHPEYESVAKTVTFPAKVFLVPNIGDL